MHSLYRVKQLILVSGDLLSFLIAFYISVALRRFSIPTFEILEPHFFPMLGTFALWIVVNYMNGLYDLIHLTNDKRLWKRLGESALFSLLIGSLFFYIIPSKEVQPKTILLLTIIFGYTCSSLFRYFTHRLVGVKQLQTRILLVGFTSEMGDLIETLKHQEKKGYIISAIIDPSKSIKKEDYPQYDVYSSLQTIRPIITNKNIDLVVAAPEIRADKDAMRELYELLFWNVSIIDLFSFYETVTGRIHPSTFSEGWFLEHLKNNKHLAYERIRFVFDYTIGFILAVFLILFFPFIALAIKINSKGPIFLKQERVGQFGKKFKLYKFRSMYALSPDGSAETKGYEFAQKNDKRVTFVGKILRKTRLDELPQCINVLKGDLTFIGPRPERPEIVADLTSHMPYYPLRHIVKPGLTGWAVLHQNYTDTLEKSLQKLQYDLYYIKNRSLLLDTSILLRTVNILIRFMGQ